MGGCQVHCGGQFMIVTVGSCRGCHSLCVGTVHGPWMSFVIHGLSHGHCGHLWVFGLLCGCHLLL